jgi:site-specific DNA-cytosine methylase
MRYLSLFSGYEGASLAWEPLGWECVAVAEIDKDACKLLKHRYPNVPNLGDVTKLEPFDIECLGPVDLVVMGAPCFPSDVLIHTKRGDISIADVVVGDMALTHKNRWRKVVTVHPSHLAYTRHLSDSDGNFLPCTPNHPIYTIDDDAVVWEEADNMLGKCWAMPWYSEGAKCRQNLFWHEVTTVIPTGLIEEVFNFEVEEDNSYVANGIVVHNCQSVSLAGKREGFFHEDGSPTRSGLFHTGLKIARWSGARFVLYENVKGLYSSNKGRDFAGVVADMAGLDDFDPPVNGWGTEGVAVGRHGLVEWACVNSQHHGLAQRRERVFVILDTGDWSNRPPIFFVPESLRWPVKKSAGKRKENAGGTEEGTGSGVCGRPVNIFGGNKRKDRPEGGFYVEMDAEVSKTLDAATGLNPTCSQGGTAVVHAYSVRTANTSSNGCGIQEEEVTHTLDATTEPAVAYSIDDNYTSGTEIMGTLQARKESGGSNMAVCYGGGNCSGPIEVSTALVTKDRQDFETETFVCEPVTYAENIQTTDLYINKGNKNDNPTETNPGEILRVLREKIGTEAFTEWGLRVLYPFQQEEILRSEVFREDDGCETYKTRCGGLNSSISCPETCRKRAVRIMWLRECEGRASYGWQPTKQFSDELAAFMQKMPFCNTQDDSSLHYLWTASNGIRVLRQALREIHSSRKPTSGEAGEIHYIVRKLMPSEAEALQGVPRDWTKVPGVSETARYKLLGNGFSVPVIRFIGEQIEKTVNYER